MATPYCQLADAFVDEKENMVNACRDAL